MNTIVGRITKNAEIKTLANDKQVVNFSLAVNDSYKTKDGERKETTTFYNCSYWLSPKIAQSLTTGTLLELFGTISTSAWMSSDGKPKSGLNFNASRIKFHSKGKSANTPTTEKPQIDNNPLTEDDLPF